MDKRFFPSIQVYYKNNLRKIAIIFSSFSLNMCFGCSKEPSNRDGSFEYPQHIFWLRNKKNNVQLRTLIWRPDTAKYMYRVYKAYTCFVLIMFIRLPNAQKVYVTVTQSIDDHD